MTLPTDANARKAVPIASGVIDYFPAALAAVAELSKKGNDQHNPGQPLFWNRGKSGDEGDALMRHFLERGTVDVDGIRHSAKVAWRALALLQKELEEAGAPLARGARIPGTDEVLDTYRGRIAGFDSVPHIDAGEITGPVQIYPVSWPEDNPSLCNDPHCDCRVLRSFAF